MAWTVTHVDSVCLKYAHNKQVQYILSVRWSTKLNEAKETKEINQAAIYCTFKVVQWDIIELKKDDHQHKGESMRTTGKKSETNQ